MSELLMNTPSPKDTELSEHPVTQQSGANAYSWITVDSDGDQIKVIWLVGDYGLLLSTRPSGEHWSAPKLMDKQRWSVPDRCLGTAQQVVEEFFREVAWRCL